MADTPETTALPSHLYACTIRTEDGTLHEGDAALLTAAERDEVIEATTDLLMSDHALMTLEVGDALVMVPVRKIISVSLIMVDEKPKKRLRFLTADDAPKEN